MVEQSSYPYFKAENPEWKSKRLSLMLTYEQTLEIASALALLHSMLSSNPLSLLFSRPIVDPSELSLQSRIHQACINAALSFEEYERSKHHEKE